MAFRMVRDVIGLAMLAAVLGGAPAGCVREVPVNRAFDVSIDEAQNALEALERDKAPLGRPVLVLAGFGDPGVVVAGLASKIEARVSNPDAVSSVSFFFEPTLEAARERVIARALERYAGGDEERLASMEFDLVGFSMGGLVARLVAAETEVGSPPLNVRRIFTISTPHRGAKASDLPSFDRKVRAMQRGSAFLGRLDAMYDVAGYELVCYVRIGDGVVGHENASPAGHPVLWVPNRAYEFAHLSAWRDPRILADLLRRLRNEPPLAENVCVPMPELE